MKFPWSWNIISEYFYEEKKHESSDTHCPHGNLYVSMNSIVFEAFGDTTDSIPPNQLIRYVLCYSLLIHATAKIPEHEITDYFDGKISLLCHLDLFEFTFQLLLKTSYYVWVKGGLWTLVRFSQEGLLFSIPVEACRNRHTQVHLGNNGLA